MRELMFRAWDKKKKQWIEGAYGFHILGEAMLIGGLFQDYRIENLNDIVIEQFTGLKDKNGTEIYQGDLVQCDYPEVSTKGRIQQILWIEEDTCFGLKPSNPYQYTRLQYSENREVIGNIHQNPELLEEKK